MLTPAPSRNGSFKRQRDSESPAAAPAPPAKKPAAACNACNACGTCGECDVCDGQRDDACDPPPFILGDLTPLATPTKPATRRVPRLESHFSDLKLWSPTRGRPPRREHAIFRTPEVVDRIMRFVDAARAIPREKPRHRRKPQSLSHALLMYDGDQAKAVQAWHETSAAGRSQSAPALQEPGLAPCLLVNKLWHAAALAIITENLAFADHRRFRQLAACPRQQRARFSRPASFVLHKLSRLTQGELDAVAPLVASEKLRWLELYICPKVLPPVPVFQHSRNIEKLVLPGNRLLTDEFIMKIAPHLGKLRVLDLRACDQITDGAVLSITSNCPLLEVCNLGRHRNGAAITSVSLVALARNTNIDTVGAAGCHVTDAGVWELAMHRGAHIRRLSLNNCRLLTNNSVPALLSMNYFPQLSVLEIRDVKHITNLRPIVAYTSAKRALGFPVLVEGGERIDLLIKEEEWRMERERSARVLAALSQWVNEEDPQD
ncbi:Amn1p [Lachancea thermotolerans CBS 6340]|uniref:KLTH0E11858p n=1 Tax=Lachancea thermotolerans (strain ATCC 56472 / CBS 6340 / NRRL Y-8284) TaxID=559295 RepID=C5DIE4_LACTC|nr:KLTH0E11858p [Lachancea thermotolerans CBS 6340]CAR23555.1 KLTH0E11858p [Lachancea thermotolerans CBS 6340]